MSLSAGGISSQALLLSANELVTPLSAEPIRSRLPILSNRIKDWHHREGPPSRHRVTDHACSGPGSDPLRGSAAPGSTGIRARYSHTHSRSADLDRSPLSTSGGAAYSRRQRSIGTKRNRRIVMTKITSGLMALILALTITAGAFAGDCCDGSKCCNGTGCCKTHQGK